MNELYVAMINAAKEITVAVLREDKSLLSHAPMAQPEQDVKETIRRVTALYRGIYSEVRDSYKSRSELREKVTNLN